MKHSFSRVYSAQPHHLEGRIITIEVDISTGMYVFSIVGLPDKAVEEARDRVGSAIKNSGFASPKSQNHKLVVSLAPADDKKEGAHFDVAIALGYLLASHEIAFDTEKKLFLGELALNGEIRPVKGVLPLTVSARQAGFTEIFVPTENSQEASIVSGITIYPVTSLRELIDHLDTLSENNNQKKSLIAIKHQDPIQHTLAIGTDMYDIIGQETAKRGLEIAASGGHNIAMSGPPGTGKTMLARAFHGLLPHLSYDELLEVTSIHSIAGNLDGPYISIPPFRSPHHTASHVSIIGGGSNPKPGEVTLAHRGVLFLDEFPEFDKRVIESLRQPMEDRYVHVTRQKGTAKFPASCILIAAMNPCPCGYLGARHKRCECRPSDIARYKRKLSGPIIDRIDVWVTVEHIEYKDLQSVQRSPYQEKSETIKERIIRARVIQQKRFGNAKKLNAHMHAKDIQQLAISDSARQLLITSAEQLKLSPRVFHRILKLAQTIADLESSDTIHDHHILEALQYRPKNG